MRIALVHMRHARSGGTERYLNQLAAHLASIGHAVTIVCRTHAEPPQPAVRFEVLRDPAVGAGWRMWAFAKSVERHLERHPYDVVMGLGRTWTQDVLRLGGGCHRTHLELTLGTSRQVWKRALGGHRLKHRLALRIEERALRPGVYRRVIANSHMVRDDVVARYAVPPHAIDVIYNGVDLERFHPRRRGSEGAELRRELGWSGEHTVVLFLGTGYARKGLSELLEAFPALARERPEARLLVVGRDSALERYRADARKLGIEGVSRFLGAREDTQACYAAADLYVLPTRYDPFANTTLEALASGLAVITTATNGGSELIAPGVEGSVLPGERTAAVLQRELVAWTDRARLEAARPAARALAERHPQERVVRESAEVLLRKP